MTDSGATLPSAALTEGDAERAKVAKKPYAPPRLTAYGDLRTLTLGPSPGIGESGNPAVFRAR